MGTKIHQIVVKIYHYILVSFQFWIGLFKGFIIYGIIPAMAALYLTFRYMKQNPDYDEASIKRAYRSYYQQYRDHKLSSFLICFAMILLFTSIFFFFIEEMGWVLIGIASYFLLLLLATFNYSIYYMTFKKLSVKDSFAYGFVNMIKNFGTSLLIVIMNALMFGLALYNLVLFIAIFPAIYGSITTYLFSKKFE